MKRKKIIALTSILTFSLNMFTPSVFAKDNVIDTNIINKNDNINTTDLENKDKQEESNESKDSTNEINVEKDDNKSNNEIKDDTSNKKEENINEKDTDLSRNAENKTENIENKAKDSTSENNSSDNTYENKIKDENTKEARGQIANVTDANLKAALNAEIAKQLHESRQPDQTIYVSELEALTGDLNLSNKSIYWIGGLEHCKNITGLDLSFNMQMTNIDALRGLSNLKSLSLRNNTQIRSIDALQGLTGLTSLNIGLLIKIPNLNAIRNMKGLTSLVLSKISLSNQDLEIIHGFKELNELYVAGTGIEDTSFLQGLSKLRTVYLNNNKISDVSALHGLNNLTTLRLEDQVIEGKEVTSSGSKAVVDNIIKGVNGEFIDIQNGTGYTYDSQTHEVTFTGITQNETRKYNFSSTVSIGNASSTFSGNVSHNIIFNQGQIANVTDANLKAALNAEIAKQLHESRQPDQTIYVSELEALTGDLNLSNKSIYWIGGLEHCKNITGLDLSFNTQIRNIEALRGLNNLKSLSLSYLNQLSDIGPIQGLIGLNKLSLGSTKIPNLNVIREFKDLTYLSAGDLRLSNQDLEIINGFKKLEELYVPSTGLEDTSFLQGLNKLRVVYLNNNRIRSTNGLQGLNALETLLLDDNQLSNVDGLQGLKSLNKVNLGENAITDISGLQGLDSLKILYLNSNQISDISVLKGLKRLTNLYLYNNKISDIRALQGLSGLTDLGLYNNKISDISPLQGLTGLKSLSLGNNKISDISPLQGLTGLTSLGLSNQVIEGKEVTSSGSKAVVDNIIKGVNGEFIDIQNEAGYTYDSQTHEVTFTGITQNETRKYNFSSTVSLGNASATFSGNVSHNIIFKEREIANVPDTNLKAALNEEIAKQLHESRQPDQTIYVSELEALTGSLNFGKKKIRILTGLEHCKNITELDLSFNQLSDISALQGLSGLTYLNLAYNYQLSDINALQGLSGLTELDLSFDNISEIGALQGLGGLINLDLGYNVINDISALQGLNKLETLYLEGNQISNISPLQGLSALTELYSGNNQISDISPLQGLSALKTLNLSNNKISDISSLQGLMALTSLCLDYNKICDLSPLNEFEASKLNISILNQEIDLGKTIVDDGSVELANPVNFPAFYSETPNLTIRPSGSISYVKDGNKLNLSDLSDLSNKFYINESTKLNNDKLNVNFSIGINLPVEHISMIKVDLPTSMVFNVVTNTVNPQTNLLEPTFVTSDYTINNRGKKPVTITPSYSVTKEGGVELVESIADNDIAKDDVVKVAVKLKELSNNKDIMSVVDGSTGTPFTLGAQSNTKLRFESGDNGMKDAEKEQLSDTKTTTGKVTFTISK